MKKILLFDVDGTLLWSGGAGIVAFDRTFLELFNVPNAYAGTRPHGKTDPLIMQEIAQKTMQRELSPQELKRARNLYETYFLEAMPHSNKFQLLPGVTSLLNVLSQDNQLFLGVATGNFEVTAWSKLKTGQIDHHFRFGGFGSDHAQRGALVKKAIERGFAQAKQNLPLRQVYVIGDTPYDVLAGKQAGARTIVVTTGRSQAADFRDNPPDHILKDLTDIPKFLAALK